MAENLLKTAIMEAHGQYMRSDRRVNETGWRKDTASREWSYLVYVAYFTKDKAALDFIETERAQGGIFNSSAFRGMWSKAKKVAEFDIELGNPIRPREMEGNAPSISSAYDNVKS